MKFSLSKQLWVLAAFFSLWPSFLFAQASNVSQNLVDCKNGRETCDRSRLSKSESAEVALSEQNVSNCTTGTTSCDRSRLTESEARESSIAALQRNIGNCRDGRYL